MELDFHVFGNVSDVAAGTENVKNARKNVKHQDFVDQQPFDSFGESRFWSRNFRDAANATGKRFGGSVQWGRFQF